MEKIYDVIIIGGGPSGLTAGIYCLRAKLKTLLIEKAFVGGEVNNTFEVQNYPGFSNISGIDLMNKMKEHCSSLNLEILNKTVTQINAENILKEVILNNGEKLICKNIILASGAKSKKLNLINETNLIGKGISYCAVCDGAFFKDKVVAVVGGGNTAMENALYLSPLCKMVYLLNRSNKFRADKVLSNRVLSNKQNNIEILENCVVKTINGIDKLESIDVEKNCNTKNLKVDGLFISIGKEPDTTLLPDLKRDDLGYVLTDENMQTSIDGVYACGDIRSKNLRQIITACSDGAIAGFCISTKNNSK